VCLHETLHLVDGAIDDCVRQCVQQRESGDIGKEQNRNRKGKGLNGEKRETTLCQGCNRHEAVRVSGSRRRGHGGENAESVSDVVDVERDTK